MQIRPTKWERRPGSCLKSSSETVVACSTAVGAARACVGYSLGRLRLYWITGHHQTRQCQVDKTSPLSVDRRRDFTALYTLPLSAASRCWSISPARQPARRAHSSKPAAQACRRDRHGTVTQTVLHSMWALSVISRQNIRIITQN